MYFKRIFTESLAHYSYVIGSGKELIIIDPQPEVDIYLDIALKTDKQITTILETHRNEDFLTGSKALSKLSEAKIYTSAESDLNYTYGSKIQDGQVLDYGDVKIKALHTPGHTLGHMAYLLLYKENPHMIFTGDSIFYGDIGRTDFYGKENLEKMCGLLYDSIFNKILPLGDEVIMFPAHGSGSACGESIEEREYSTLGYERRNNPKLQYSNKEEFVSANKKMLFKPFYFDYMEEINLIGTPAIDCNLKVNFKTIDQIESDVVVDIRDQNAFNHGHIPGSIWIKKENILSFINWVVERDSDITIVSDIDLDKKAILQDLKRIGYTGQISYLLGGFDTWYMAHKSIGQITTVLPKDYNLVKEEHFIVDVRKESEVDKPYGDKGTVIPIEKITRDYKTLIDKKNILLVCPSGVRSNIVASYLKSKDIDVKLLIGGLELVK